MDELNFSYVRRAEPLLPRAEKRLGRQVASLTPQEKKRLFYSYFSEIGGDEYEQALRKQYEAYLPFLTPGRAEPFLDIGCGAGEFIAFLNSMNVKAIGIDLASSEVERARARGLQVAEGEALDYLTRAPQKFSGISLIEVIEHVPFDTVDDVVGAAADKLISGGALIVETINIRHPITVDLFYTDPTHQRPVPEGYVTFLMEWHGLKDIKIVYTNPVPVGGVDHGDIQRVYCTYAAIGRKP